MKKLIIFDVCNTFVKTNSTYSYLNFLIDAGVKPFYKYIFFLKGVGFIYSVLKKLTGLDCEVKLIGLYFKGINKSKLADINHKFFRWYESQISKKFEKLLEDSKGCKIIFLSAAINPPIDYLKDKYGIEGFSSVLEEKYGVYTGKFRECLRGHKESVFISGKFSLKEYEFIELYTDNTDDCNLIMFLKGQSNNLKVNIVPYNNIRYRKRFFNGTNINYEFIS